MPQDARGDLGMRHPSASRMARHQRLGGARASDLLPKPERAEELVKTRHLVAGLVIPMSTEVYAVHEPLHLSLLSATELTARYPAALSFRAVVCPADGTPSSAM